MHEAQMQRTMWMNQFNSILEFCEERVDRTSSSHVSHISNAFYRNVGVAYHELPVDDKTSM